MEISELLKKIQKTSFVDSYYIVHEHFHNDILRYLGESLKSRHGKMSNRCLQRLQAALCLQRTGVQPTERLPFSASGAAQLRSPWKTLHITAVLCRGVQEEPSIVPRYAEKRESLRQQMYIFPV